ncbi:hypothetical protein [Superficieibacter electus]|uniref:hypothetical protein n=1 Tax=Superficieibacter electus TaxID=2022662 RepID=UPI001057256C|nr:hypothetical protein [Superficieibacter electus]
MSSPTVNTRRVALTCEKHRGASILLSSLGLYLAVTIEAVHDREMTVLWRFDVWSNNVNRKVALRQKRPEKAEVIVTPGPGKHCATGQNGHIV